MAKAVPGKKYVKITVKDKKSGALKRVTMEASKAAALRKKRSVAGTSKLIPSQYRGSVDPSAIDNAVAAHIQSLNQPLDQLGKEASTQFDTNVRMNDQLGQQTQATLDQLLQNADARTSGFQQLAGQSIAAQQGTNRDAASAIARSLGAAFNPLVAGMVEQDLAPMQAQQHSQGVGDTWMGTLSSGAQRDFFERGKGIQAITQSAFNEGQRRDLQTTLGRIAAQQAANNQQKAALVREFSKEDAQFALEQQTAAQAFGQQQFENSLALDNAATDRIDAMNDGSGGSGGTSSGLSKDAQKRVLEVRKYLDGRLKLLGTVSSTEGSGDTKKTYYWDNKLLFPGTGGPWREAHARLTAPEVGMSADQAALFASRWFKSSLTRSTPAKIKTMLEGRGVTPAMQKQLITSAFGPKGWLDVTRSPAAAVANNPTRGSGTYMPTGTGGNVSLWADKQVKALKGKTITPKAAPTYSYKLQSFSNGKWWFKNLRTGATFTVSAKANELAAAALQKAIANGHRAGRGGARR